MDASQEQGGNQEALLIVYFKVHSEGLLDL